MGKDGVQLNSYYYLIIILSMITALLDLHNILPQAKIMAAMSGGVDSSVTAALLKRRGFETHGVFMTLGGDKDGRNARRAVEIADFLEIPFTVLDLSLEFKKEVLDYFQQTYEQGLTPNPCAVCNRTIKFGRLMDYALGRGMDYLATGHYARLCRDNSGPVRLLKGADATKDQSYFLCRLRQPQLAHALFPLAAVHKREVYEMAAELGLKGRHGTESQDVCFMAGRSLNEYFAACLPPAAAGDFVTLKGERKGRHRGIRHYTIGQRRGLGIPDATPYYVVALNAAANEVVIGKDDDLWQRRLMVGDINWLPGQAPELPAEFSVKIRYRHQGAVALVRAAAKGLFIEFNEAQRAVTPGQFAVLYQDDEVIGSGRIIRADE